MIWFGGPLCAKRSRAKSLPLFICQCLVVINGVTLIFQYWERFGGCCQRAQGAFSIQSKDAYKFLEIIPSSLSEDEWKEQYESVMKKLKQISPQGSSTATITEI